MKILLRQFIILLLIISALLSIYFGAYLPFTKSQRYIAAIRAVSSVKSVADFKKNFDAAINYYSPIGDEEVMKFLGNDILGIITGQDQPEAVSRELVEYVEPHMFKNDTRHLIALGQMYFTLWQKYGKKDVDYAKAEEYFLGAYSIGPKLPPVLYSLLDLYRLKGDGEKLKNIASEILTYWPDDESVKNVLGS